MKDEASSKMKKNNSLFQTALMVSILTVIGKLLGFGRDAVIAAYYGATSETDAYFFANAMPGTLFPAVCSSLSVAFTSIYIKRFAEEDKGASDRYASRMLIGTSIIGIVLGLVGIVIAPIFVPLIAVGFEGSQLALAIQLTELTMGSFVLLMLQYMLCAVLNSKKIFVAPQIAGVLYNIVIIAVTVGLGRSQSMEVLTLTTVGALGVQVVVLVLFCYKKLRFSLQLKGILTEMKQLLLLALPILLGNSVVQINSIVEKALGSGLSEGALSALNYANTLNSVVTGVFIMSISTVLFPTLTVDATSGNMEKYGKTLSKGLNLLSIILIPISCITLIDAKEIVTIVFARGSFSEAAVVLTSTVLMCVAPRFVFYGICETLTKGFYAVQDTKSPMKNSTIGVLFNIAFSLIFVRWLGIVGIALGTTLSIVLRTILLFCDAKKRLPDVSFGGLVKSVGKQMMAGIMVTVFLVGFHSLVEIAMPLLCFMVDTVIGVTIYFVIVWLFDVDDVRQVIGSVIKKVRRGK